MKLSFCRCRELTGLLDLVGSVPEELVVLSGKDFAELICSVATIRERIELWRLRHEHANELGFLRGFRQLSPVTLIHQAFAKCPDQVPGPGSSELSFVSDSDLRRNLRDDIGSINQALSNGEWKAATVLAGSTIEALLLWDLTNRHTAQVPAAVTALVTNKTFIKNLPSNPEDWVLHHYIEVAANIGIIMPDTVKEARLAKDFRNLIHPGRAQRLGQKCDRGTALASVAALEHVVRDLS